MVRVYKAFFVLVYGSASGHDFDAVCTTYMYMYVSSIISIRTENTTSN